MANLTPYIGVRTLKLRREQKSKQSANADKNAARVVFLGEQQKCTPS